jgi:hypothetical protein
VLWLALIAPEPCHAHRRAQLPLLAADAQPRAHARNKLPLSLYSAPDISAISPAVRFTSVSHHLSLAVSTAVRASPSSSNWPRSAYDFAKCHKYHGVHSVERADRHAVIAEVINWAAFEVLPAGATGRPCLIIPAPSTARRLFRMPRLQARRPVRLPLRKFPQCISVSGMCASANTVAAWPTSRASLRARFVSASAASG